MKLGPIHLLRGSTYRKLDRLHKLWDHFSRSLAAEADGGNRFADLVLDHTSGLHHSPLCVRVAPVAFTESPADDPAGFAAAERVTAAYRLAAGEGGPPPAPSMWDHLGRARAGFVGAMLRNDVPAVHAALARLFATDLVTGLGQFHPSHQPLLEEGGVNHVSIRFTDTLISLAEAVAAARVTHMVQDPAAHLQPLNRPHEPVVRAVTKRLGFDPSVPAAGSVFGFRIAGKLYTIDSLTHAYNAYRVRQLAGETGTAFEIGGGYGCLALMAHRAGVRDYAIFDLPWVNALQGYFLIRSLPEGTVRLYGEEAGRLRVLPYWALDREPAGVCDVVVNTDSLPEMGRDTAAGYLPKIRRVARAAFLSVNQEAMAHEPGVGPQQCVAELADELGGFERVLRQRYWMRQGYVEEVYRPCGAE